ncbi:MAG: glycosyl transferase [Rhodospirillales bacterium]|jgi:predicted glycosyltransferase|nr:glycosyl transferase [Rhodospirillales bacterium]
MAGRILIYVQHLLGIGHLKRAAAIARASAATGAHVTVAIGGHMAPGMEFGDAEIYQLPCVSAADDGFTVLLDERGQPIDEDWRMRRREALLACFDATRPDVMVLELYPFGRRQFRFELLPLLERAATLANPPRIACSVRDILVSKARPERNREIVDIINKYFDAVLVHGDPELIPFAQTFPAAREIENKIRYTGYVVNGTHADFERTSEAGEVIVSAGGGSVGEPLLRAAIAARAMSSAAEIPWRVLSGPNLPNDVFEDMKNSAPAGVTIERHRDDFPALLANCHLSISQAGYNTVMDILMAHARAIVVPFAGGKESEQTVRAKLLAERGCLKMIDPAELGPKILAAKIDEALAGVPARAKGLNFDGGAGTAAALHALCRQSG